MFTTISLGDVYKCVAQESWFELSHMFNGKAGPFWIRVAGPIIFDYWSHLPMRRGNEFRLDDQETRNERYFDVTGNWGVTPTNTVVPHSGLFIPENVQAIDVQKHLVCRFGPGLTLIRPKAEEPDANSRFLEKIRAENSRDPDFQLEIMTRCLDAFALDPDIDDEMRQQIYEAERERLRNPHLVFNP